VNTMLPTDPIEGAHAGREILLGMGLVVLALLGGCSTTSPVHELHPVGSSTRVTTVAIQTIYRKILVPVVLNGSQRGTFLLDTGANITVITPMLAKRLGGDQPTDGPKTKARMASGQDVEVSLIRVKSIGVGSARVENFALAVYDLPPLALGAPSPITVDGLLGNDFVGLFTMTVDQRAGKLTLRLDLPAR
jgi:predicted aspartyl protease